MFKRTEVLGSFNFFVNNSRILGSTVMRLNFHTALIVKSEQFNSYVEERRDIGESYGVA